MNYVFLRSASETFLFNRRSGIEVVCPDYVANREPWPLTPIFSVTIQIWGAFPPRSDLRAHPHRRPSRRASDHLARLANNNVTERLLFWYSNHGMATWQALSSTVPRKSVFCCSKSVLLYGCETWSLTLREERRLRVFENRVLRRVFGSKRDEVTGEWRKLHNEEFSDLYSLPNIVRVVKSRRMRWARHVARMGEGRGVHKQEQYHSGPQIRKMWAGFV